MTYDENVFKEKANRKARKIWIVFAVLLPTMAPMRPGDYIPPLLTLFSWHCAGCL